MDDALGMRVVERRADRVGDPADELPRGALAGRAQAAEARGQILARDVLRRDVPATVDLTLAGDGRDVGMLEGGGLVRIRGEESAEREVLREPLMEEMKDDGTSTGAEGAIALGQRDTRQAPDDRVLPEGSARDETDR